MSAVGLSHLDALYAETSDPWNFEHSDYEQAKFRATLAALSRPRYDAVFELGCGNGQLARHLAQVADCYVGMDAIDKALDAGRRAVPSGEFHRGFYPCRLPDGEYDLLVLSEILYFLDPAGLTHLAGQIAERWPRAEVVCVTWLGATGNPLQGNEALGLFMKALPGHVFTRVAGSEDYRIDRGLPGGQG